MIERRQPIPLRCTDNEPIFIGIDVSKEKHLASFVSATLLAKHRRYDACPTLEINNTRTDFELLIKEMQRYATLDHCAVLMEKTGHYHLALRHYLQERGVAVYELHVQKRLSKVKNDKRDAQGLANLLYNQIALGVQYSNADQEARKVAEPSETAQALHVLTHRRYELSQSTTRLKNKLTALLDEVFPEFASVIGDPLSTTSLNIREHFGTPQALAMADFGELCACRSWRRPSDADLHELQERAATSIGTKAPGRLTMLTMEQRQLIEEYRLLTKHITEIEDQIASLVEETREAQILMSIGFGPNQAAAFLAVVDSIENVESASKLKGLAGWHPVQSQTGTSMDSMVLSKEGNRILRNVMFMVGMKAIQGDTEWRDLYNKLIPRICQRDDRIGIYRGKRKPLGHVIGRILCVAYALLKKDFDLVANTKPDETLPPPTLYNRDIHRGHRQRRQA